jgi:hypothetical protein
MLETISPCKQEHVSWNTDWAWLRCSQNEAGTSIVFIGPLPFAIYQRHHHFTEDMFTIASPVDNEFFLIAYEMVLYSNSARDTFTIVRSLKSWDIFYSWFDRILAIWKLFFLLGERSRSFLFVHQREKWLIHVTRPWADFPRPSTRWNFSRGIKWWATPCWCLSLTLFGFHWAFYSR